MKNLAPYQNLDLVEEFLALLYTQEFLLVLPPELSWFSSIDQEKIFVENCLLVDVSRLED